MAKKTNIYASSMKEALEKFDLELFKKWVKKYSPLLFKQFKKANETVQWATMCKMICNRTDLLETEAHKKARAWLKEHNMKGQIW